MPKKQPSKKTTAAKKKGGAKPEPMPSLIFATGKIEAAKKTIQTEKAAEPVETPTMPAAEEAQRYLPGYNPVARRWMWLGVILVSAIIIIFWGWSLELSVRGVNWHGGSDGQLMTAVQSDWNNAFAANQKTVSIQDGISAFVSRLAAAKAALAATSTTTTDATATIITTTTTAETVTATAAVTTTKRKK